MAALQDFPAALLSLLSEDWSPQCSLAIICECSSAGAIAIAPAGMAKGANNIAKAIKIAKIGRTLTPGHMRSTAPTFNVRLVKWAPVIMIDQFHGPKSTGRQAYD